MQRIAILSFCLLSTCCIGQTIDSKIFVDNQFMEERSFQDTLRLQNFIELKKTALLQEDYPFSGLDSMVQDSGVYRIYFHKGASKKLVIEGVRKNKLMDRISDQLTAYSNAGYPFAQIRIDSFEVSKEYLKGQLVVEKGPEIRFDSLFFISDINTGRSYVNQLLGIRPGQLFNEKNYLEITQRMNRSSFLTLNRTPDLSFSANKARVFLDLQETTSSSFEGILGLQENQNGGTSLVGSIDLSIMNLFRSGHEFEFAWERFAEESQQLDLYYKHAFLWGGDFSPSVRFGLVKQDTSFLTRTTGIGINAFIRADLLLLLEYEGTNGSLIASDIDNIQSRNLADFQRDFYRLKVSKGFESVLNSFSEGMVWNASLGIGNKEINRNLALPASYYDTLAQNTEFLQLDGRLMYQFKVGKRQTLFHDVQAGLLRNEVLLTNELYRLGGLASLRGFNEKRFFARDFALSRLEFRSYFESSSFLYAFYDQLIFRRAANVQYPFGIGIGIALETSSSQFRFAFASGSSDDQAISFSELRVHFGFLTKF